MYGAVTFTATAFVPESTPTQTKTSGNTVTVTDSAKMSRSAISNAVILNAAVSEGLIPETKGYSIVCPDDFESGMEFFAYKKGAELVSLAPIISFTEASNVQAANTVTTSNLSTGAESINQSGTEKSYATGKFLGMDAAINRTITFKSGTVRLNGTTYSYFPSTSSATFFGGASDTTRFVEGKFSIAASKPIQVPVQ
jgi:hypothetical protein